MSSVEEALMRAKAIAARLSNSSSGIDATGNERDHDREKSVTTSITSSASGQSVPTGTSSPLSGLTGKRKRWGVVPDELMMTAAASTSGASITSMAAKLTIVKEESIQKRIWVATSDEEKPVSHFVSFLNRKLPELKPSLLVEGNSHQAGGDVAEQLDIELQGRGSSSRPPVPGMPEQPLHVFLSGPSRLIKLAVPLVERLLQEAQEAPLEGVDEALNLADHCDDSNANKGALVSLYPYNSNSATNSASSSSYRPASVAQLIGQANMPSSSGRGFGSSSDGGGDGQTMIEEEMSVPHGVVGFIIGRGGENITHMQAKTGCKVQIQKESDLQPGQSQRIITLVASSQEAIDACRQRIETMVQERIRAAGGGNNNAGVGSGNHGGIGNVGMAGGPGVGAVAKDAKVQEALNAGHAHIEMQIPEEDVGLVIGKMGSTIKSIQEQTGASIQVPPSASVSNGFRTIHVTHPHMDGVQSAKLQVENILKSKPTFQSRGPQVTVQLSIPDKDVGLCIGRQGCVIRQMQNMTNTRIQIPPHAMPGEMHRVASVTGSQDGCEQVQQMIHRIITEQSSFYVMSGLPFTGSSNGIAGQSYQQQHDLYSSQADQSQQIYSAEWAAYHAAQAAAQQQQEQQQQQQQAVVAPVDAGPAADAYYEQFFRYAYYYGEEAARTYYGAWSPPPGTLNPYGINPAGIQLAPSASIPESTTTSAVTIPSVSSAELTTTDASNPVETTTTQVSVPSEARETGRRKVSNLPAWMTKN